MGGCSSKTRRLSRGAVHVGRIRAPQFLTMRGIWTYLLIIAATAVALELLKPNDDRIPYGRFRELVEHGQISDVAIEGDTYVGRTPQNPNSNSAHLYRTGRIESAEPELL